MDSLFVVHEGGFQPTELARGPWDPGALHGGPTAALIVRQAEAHLAGGAWQVARVTIELLRPVPVERLVVRAETVRPGRKVTLTEVSVVAGRSGSRSGRSGGSDGSDGTDRTDRSDGTDGSDGREVARAVVLSVRRTDLSLPPPSERHAPVGDPDALERPDAVPSAAEWPAFHNRGVEMRWARGVWRQPGPATVWMRLRVPVVAGEETSPAMLAVAVADFGNGVSSELDFAAWRFLNPELTVHLARAPVGEWVRIDARTVLGPAGAGVASSELADRDGPFGRAAQSLFIEPV
ncbi:MAG: thioesterase family protein [Acidimicrobiales bacterium]